MNRAGEQGSAPERASRFFERDNYWYYRTREGLTFGPFDTRSDATQGASEFIDFIRHADGWTLEQLEIYRQSAA